ncbi:MAG: M23 family metallopeptidase [Defluviitaleaceae bacterium]|nr:M23 family metallopeptidase [Defluviitaleaceae bacterium]
MESQNQSGIGIQKAAQAGSEAVQVAKMAANIAKGAAMGAKAGGVGAIPGAIAAAGKETLKNPMLVVKIVIAIILLLILPVMLIAMLPLIAFNSVDGFVEGVWETVGGFFRSLPMIGSLVIFFFGGGTPAPDTAQLPNPIHFINAFDMAHIMSNLEEAHSIIGNAHLTHYEAIQAELGIIIAELPEGAAYEVNSVAQIPVDEEGNTENISEWDIVSFGTASILGMYSASLHNDITSISLEDLAERLSIAGSGGNIFMLEGPDIREEPREITLYYPPNPESVTYVLDPEIGLYTTPGWIWSNAIDWYRPEGWVFNEDSGEYHPPPPMVQYITIYTFTIVYAGEMVFAESFGIADNEELMIFAQEYTRNLMILLTDQNMTGAFNMRQPGIVDGFYSPFPDLPWRVSSPFGYRFHPIWHRWQMHNGIDIPKPAGTPIRAVARGTVTHSGWIRGFGVTVIIEHGDIRGDGANYRTLYAHNSRNNVVIGQQVQAGDIIAFVGTTGDSTGNHLHLEIIRNGIHQDPLAYIGTPPGGL